MFSPQNEDTRSLSNWKNIYLKVASSSKDMAVPTYHILISRNGISITCLEYT